MPTSPPPSYTPGQAGPPAFPPPGQGPTGSGSSRGNTKLLLAILGGLVGVVVLVIVLVLALGGGDPSSDDPAETVASFFDATSDGDCAAAFALLTDNARSTFGGDAGVDDCESADPSEAFGDQASIDIGEARVDGDDATVPVGLTDESGELDALGLGELTLDFGLTKEDGAWLIDDFGLASLLENLPDLGDPGDLGDLPEELPSDGFTDDPFSDLPSDFPSDLFSDLPSDFPSDLLSDLPSDFPTDLLSDFPSDFDPDEFLSDFPSDLFSDPPTG